MKTVLTPLSKTQISGLCALAGKAFKVSRLRGAVDDDCDLETFRREGQIEACGMSSLKECHQGHFLAIRGKWFTVLGRLEEAFNDFLNAGDAAAALKQMRWRFIGQLSFLAEAIGEKHERETGIVLDDPTRAARAYAYAQSIAQVQFQKGLKSLDARQVEILGFTVTNRANALAGRGRTENRNKSQRLKSPKAGEEELPVMERAVRRLAQKSPACGSDRL